MLSYLAPELLGLFAGVVLLFQVMVRHAKTGLIGLISESIVAAFIPLGVLAYVLVPKLTSSVILFWGYTPHAYNLIIWPLFALFFIRKRFGAKLLLPYFVFLYGLDEVLWNALAYARFQGDPVVLEFMGLFYWQIFYLAVVLATIIGYLVLRPRIKPNWGWVSLIAYAFVYAFLAGLPVGSVDLYNLTWELLWQSAIFAFVWTSVFPREAQGDELHIERPSVG